MSEPTLCCRARGGYCDRCDLLVGLGGLHVIGVDRDDGGALTVTVESAAEVMGCPAGGVLAHAHHVSTKPVDEGGRGPKELTGMVDLSRDERGNVRARLLDLVPGRSGQVYTTWLTERSEAFRQRVQIATLDPFHGYKNAIDDQLEDARSVPGRVPCSEVGDRSRR